MPAAPGGPGLETIIAGWHRPVLARGHRQPTAGRQRHLGPGPCKPYLAVRWDQGITSIRALHQEITAAAT